MLIGYGAAAVNPYLAFESIEDLVREGELTGIEAAAAVRNYLKALGKGVMKVMSKMGISTVASYTAAQAFEAIGLDRDVVDEYFTGTPSQLGGVGLDVIAEEVKQRHRRAYPENPTERVHRRLEVGGEYAVPPGGRAPPVHARSRFSCCSIRPAPGVTTSSSSTPRRSTGCPVRAARCAGCSTLKTGVAATGAADGGRIRRLDLSPGSTPAR